MVRGIVDNFKCSQFFSFLHLHVSRLSFLASLCSSIYDAAFERMLTSRGLCAIIRQCRITLSLIQMFAQLNCNCSLNTAHSVYLHFLGQSLELKDSFFCCAVTLNRTFLHSYKRRLAIPTKDNQMTCSEIILQDPTEKCP